MVAQRCASAVHNTLRRRFPVACAQAWQEAPWRGPEVRDAEFSVSVASPEEAARAAEERRLEEEEAVMQQEACPLPEL